MYFFGVASGVKLKDKRRTRKGKERRKQRNKKEGKNTRWHEGKGKERKRGCEMMKVEKGKTG